MSAAMRQAAGATSERSIAEIHATTLLIRQSAMVQRARMSIITDSALLAAEQVQDIRLSLLEAPAKADGWEFWLDFSLSFLLDAKLLAKGLTMVTRKILEPALRTNAVFLALPKSTRGMAAAATAATAKPVEKVFEGGRLRVELPDVTDSKALELYSQSIAAFIEKGSGVIDDITNATLKAAKKGWQQKRKSPVGDSAGVTVLSAAQQYCQASVLAIELRHTALEYYVAGGIPLSDHTAIRAALQWEELVDDQQVKDEIGSSSEARTRYRMLLEIVIWARMYRFSSAPPDTRSNPQVLVNKDEFAGIRPELQMYWRGRFQAMADSYAERSGTVVRGDRNQTLRLQRYFAGVARSVAASLPKGNDLMAGLDTVG